MIVAWMLFALEVSALLFVAAWIAERSLLALRRPVRGVWIAAIVGANLLPVILSQVSLPTPLAQKFALSVAPESVWARIGTPLLVLWAIAAAAGVLVCLAAVWRMARARPSWKTEHVDNTPVLVSHDIGPALVGVLQYSIVVPAWAQSLESRARTMLLAHEREHARHFDPLVLTAGLLAVVVAPWNVFNWLFLKRLHLAVELDCDQRVLRAHPDTQGYGALLLDVAERVLPSVLPTAAFVEHGASLEKRINAMSERAKSMKTLRVATGLSVSTLFAAAACFTPRPYAIVIVYPPAGTGLGQAPAVSAYRMSADGNVSPVASATPTVDSAFLRGLAQELLAQQARAPQTLDSAPRVAAHQSFATNRDPLKPVMPSARTLALDSAAVAFIHTLVVKNAPRTLSNFPRADSALVMLFDRNDRLVKHVGISLADVRPEGDAMRVFSTVFPMPEINGIESASEYSIERDRGGQMLRVPLRVFSAYMLAGIPTPRTKAELVPTQATMIADARAHSQLAFAGKAPGGFTSALLYDTRGVLIKGATITAADSAKYSNGSAQYGYEQRVLREALGVESEGGSIIGSGMHVLHDSISGNNGPGKIVFAIQLQPAEFSTFMKLIQNDERNWASAGSSSRTPTTTNTNTMAARLRGLVQAHTPDAYGDWARGDSAVIFLLDANDQLIDFTAGPIPANRGMEPLADLISLRFLHVPGSEINQVGWTKRIASESGRVLDKPLVVIWGRLSAEATRQRMLKRTSP